MGPSGSLIVCTTLPQQPWFDSSQLPLLHVIASLSPSLGNPVSLELSLSNEAENTLKNI